MQKTLFILISVFFTFLSYSQSNTQITHFSVDKGLSENRVLSMLQDSKGIMWFGTYDGLNKFNGYFFERYKGRESQKYKLKNFRIDNIIEDKYGYLWVQSNDGGVYRFDSSTEEFLPIPQCFRGYKEFNSPLSKISVLSDGSVWIYNNSVGKENCFVVKTDEVSGGMKLTRFVNKGKSNETEKIYRLYSDKNNSTWLLTSIGVITIKNGENKPKRLNTHTGIQKFYSIFDKGDEIVLGGERGVLLFYNIKNATNSFVTTGIRSDIIDIRQLNDDELFLLTNSTDFYIYNTRKKTFEKFELDRNLCVRAEQCYLDRNNDVWLNTQYSGAVLFDVKRRKINYLSIKPIRLINSTPDIFRVFEDKFNNIWVQIKFGGLYRYNRTNNVLEQIPPANPGVESISDVVRVACSDTQGNLWVGTYLQGVDKVVFSQSSFRFMKPIRRDYYSMSNEVRAIYEDSSNQLWVSSKNGFLYVYDSNRELKGTFGENGRIDNGRPFKIPVYAIHEDHNGNLWLGTKNSGLFKLSKLDNDCYRIENFTNNPNDLYSISSNSVYTIYEDHLNRLWIGTFGGGVNIAEVQNGKTVFINHRNRLKDFQIKQLNKVRFITQDTNKNIYICTTQGLAVSSNGASELELLKFTIYSYSTDNKYSISGNDIHYLLQASTGDIFISAIGGGVCVCKAPNFNADQLKFETIKENEEDVTSLVYAMKEDEEGNIWMSAQTQLIKYNLKTSKTSRYKPFDYNNSFFSEAAAFKDHKGDLWYGTSDGILHFNPKSIKLSAYIPKLYLANLQIFNKTVRVNEENSPLKRIIDVEKEIRLNHDQNIFSIEYAALDYVNPDNIEYAYMLEGLDSYWHYVGKQRNANFINLPKGKYVFKVKSTNSDGVWVNNEKRITIIKLPSFWESAWGVVFYVILFFVLSLVVAYILFVIYRLRNEIDVEQRINNIKLRFFTDISHELRTPLTLITSPVENLLKKENLSEAGRGQLEMIQRNTNRMLRLINQILDFRKIQNNKMKLIIESVYISDFLYEIKRSFVNVSEDRIIEIKITDTTNNAQLWIDKDKCEKIFFNLFSNAFKYTIKDSEVQVIITEDKNTITITVKDQGVGISKDRLKLLFERFESFALPSGFAFKASSGIGLSLTKELVELHKGKIEVDSELGVGSEFRVTFLKGILHFGKSEEYVIGDITKEDETVVQQTATNQIAQSLNELADGSERKRILIVEDNSELRSFIVNSLSDKYNVNEASDGRNALCLAMEINPDLIISDIMMPDVDGLDLTRSIKSEMELSHIPIILLTARTDNECKIDALGMGADDYITKPFSISYLEARIDNLLKTREQLQARYRLPLLEGVITLAKPDITNLDEVFINKTINFLENNYENSEMTIDNIAQDIGMSRSSFFSKIKSLTGLAPGDFVREFRLQKAIQLISAGETNVSQIAYSVGINDNRYFRKWFKQKYGITPSEYVNKTVVGS